MTLSSQLTTDLSIFFDTDEFAQSVTYAGSVINAIVSDDENLDAAGSRESAMAKGTIWVKVSDVTLPAYRDAVVIGSDTWYVRRIVSGDGYVWQVEIYRGQRPVWG